MRSRSCAVLVTLALAVAGCSSSTSDEPESAESAGTSSASTSSASPSSEAPTTASPTEAPTTETPTPSESPRPYEPSRAEVDAGVKRAAARAVEDLSEVSRVTFTQYFGYLPPAASILVEADFVDGGGTTYDVRLTRSGDRWEVDSVEPATLARTLRDRGSLIRQVLDSDRITLPWAGRYDVASGRVADSVLRSMLTVAEEHRIVVSVIIAAHPVNVFGTDRRSNHPDGLAYDIGRIDGRLVVDPRAASLVEEVMELASTTGAYQVGGPTDLDGGGSQYFSDPTHSDHVHVGFNG